MVTLRSFSTTNSACGSVLSSSRPPLGVALCLWSFSAAKAGSARPAHNATATMKMRRFVFMFVSVLSVCGYDFGRENPFEHSGDAGLQRRVVSIRGNLLQRIVRRLAL